MRDGNGRGVTHRDGVTASILGVDDCGGRPRRGRRHHERLVRPVAGLERYCRMAVPGRGCRR